MSKSILLFLLIFPAAWALAQPAGGRYRVYTSREYQVREKQIREQQAREHNARDHQSRANANRKARHRLRGWHLSDWKQDSLPGISLEKAYAWLDTHKSGHTGEEVVVAVLDTKLDIRHEAIRDNLWTNPGEIPGNGLDDDGNGYTDDVHGWNFLGNSAGEDVLYQLSETARAARLLEQIDTAALRLSDPKRLATLQKYAAAYREDAAFFRENYRALDSILSREEAALRDLAALGDNAALQDGEALRNGAANQNEAVLRESRALRDQRKAIAIQKQFFYNPDYQERAITGDRPDDLYDRRYGNPVISGRAPMEHALGVAGVLAARPNNRLGVAGVSEKIRIMPVVMVAEGDEHDKDVALAIRYAVDNGAKIINMSWGKRQSLYPGWVQDAIRYASQRDVLLVHSAGNTADDLDAVDYYPLDYTPDGEFTESFLSVGALSPRKGPALVASFSNYGQRNVDLFAPGNFIFTPHTGNGYAYKQGTSYAAPLVAGVAALVWSHYPDFTAAEIKDILMASATRVDGEVYLPRKTRSASPQRVPFTRLCKSGGILNAFAALQLAAVRNRTRL